MADKKISELTALTTPADADVFAIVDDSADETKKISFADLADAIGGGGGGGGGGDIFANFLNSVNFIDNSDDDLVANTLNLVRSTTANNTVTLPAPAEGLVVGVQITRDTSKLVFIAPHASELIDGLSSYVLFARESALFWSDGTDWMPLTGRFVSMNTRLFRDTDQTGIATNTWTPILMTDQSFGPAFMFDSSNHRAICKRAGRYLVSAFAYVSGSGGSYMYITAGINGTNLGWYQQSSPVSGSAAGAFDTLIDLSIGDYVQPFVYTDIGSAKILGAGGSFVAISELPH